MRHPACGSTCRYHLRLAAPLAAYAETIGSNASDTAVHSPRTGTLLAQVGDKLLTVVGCDLMGAVAYKDWAQTVNAVEKG